LCERGIAAMAAWFALDTLRRGVGWAPGDATVPLDSDMDIERTEKSGDIMAQQAAEKSGHRKSGRSAEPGENGKKKKPDKDIAERAGSEMTGRWAWASAPWASINVNVRDDSLTAK